MPYDLDAPKRPVKVRLNEDLVRRARELGGDLSEQVEKLLAEYVTAEEARRIGQREARLDRAVVAWNEFNEQYGSFADDYSPL